MVSRVRHLQKLRDWLRAQRKIGSTSYKVGLLAAKVDLLTAENAVFNGKAGATAAAAQVDQLISLVSHLHEKLKFAQEECDRIAALYDSVAARTALLEHRAEADERRASTPPSSEVADNGFLEQQMGKES